MEDFIEEVKVYALTDSNAVFNNKDEKHGRIVMAEIFKKAQNIKLYSGELSPNIFDSDEFIDSLRLFISKPDSQINILVESEPLKDSRIMNILKQYSSKVKIRKINNDILQKWVALKANNHFVVADGVMFRYETKHGGSRAYEAICSFNKTDIAQTLETNFNNLYLLNSTDISDILK